MDKDIEEIKKKIEKSLKPIVGNIQFLNSNGLSFHHGKTATFINVKKRNSVVIVDLMSPVLMNLKIEDGILDVCNSYNLEEKFTLVYNNTGKDKFLLLRDEFRGEFFDAEEFQIKIRSMGMDAENLIGKLSPFWPGETFSEFHGL